MGVAATVAFFGSLILHELGHAYQARREGVRIEGITLWLFGGVAKIAGEIPSAGAEFRIAVAGPAVTLAIGAICILGAAALAPPGAVESVIAGSDTSTWHCWCSTSCRPCHSTAGGC